MVSGIVVVMGAGVITGADVVTIGFAVVVTVGVVTIGWVCVVVVGVVTTGLGSVVLGVVTEGPAVVVAGVDTSGVFTVVVGTDTLGRLVEEGAVVSKGAPVVMGVLGVVLNGFVCEAGSVDVPVVVTLAPVVMGVSVPCGFAGVVAAAVACVVVTSCGFLSSPQAAKNTKVQSNAVMRSKSKALFFISTSFGEWCRGLLSKRLTGV